MLSKIKTMQQQQQASELSEAAKSTSAASNNSNQDQLSHDDDQSTEELVLDTSSARASSSASPIEDSNNNLNLNNNNSISPSGPSAKKNQDELLDIVELSRKRRLSKDSADSLTSFIRWSFGHVGQPEVASLNGGSLNQTLMARKFPLTKPEGRDQEMEEGVELDNEWSNNNSAALLSSASLRKKLKAENGLVGCSAIDFALQLKNQQQQQQQQQQQTIGLNLTNNQANPVNLRSRQRVYSPETIKSLQGKRSVGNVVERLHQQQQHLNNNNQQLANGDGPTSGLSFHLQQFLQQQTSIEDLCSTVGLSDNNNQLVLAAAIHRALIESNSQNGTNQSNQNNPLETKSTASSVGSSSSSVQQMSEALGQQRRTYNTRAAQLHTVAGPQSQFMSRQQQQQTQALSLANQSSRLQQQRHSQAAAALSALAASATQNSTSSHHLAHLHQHHQHHHHHLPLGQQQQQHPLHHQLAASALASLTQTNPLLAAGQQAIVDFKCDTCPSSFDDRHRLMQHQSIHLELKKDWFTETPVEEVMKIFRRRRGEFLCNLCNLRFEATLDYDQHNHQVHGPRPYCCQFCGNGTRTFKCWRQYLNHLYDHRYIFSCTIDDCDFTVNRRDSLRFHIFRFHLNCQLPRNVSLNGGHLQLAHSKVQNLMLNNNDPKWAADLNLGHDDAYVDDDDDDAEVDDLDRDDGGDDTENEMNVAD